MQLRSEDDAKDFVASRCEPLALSRLETLIANLRVANARQNLVSATTLPTIWLRHIADSAQLLDHVPRETRPWLDLGSGAGFPGLVIATMLPNQEVFLIESRKLRIDWLRAQIETLGLPNCRIIGSDVKQAPAISAGVISARAFAPLDRLIALSARFSTTTTSWVLPKGRSAAQEVAVLPARLREMFHVEQSVTSPDGGIVVGMGEVELTA